MSTLKKTLLLILIIFSAAANAQIIDSAKMPSAEIRTFHSAILGENRTIYIQTPSKMKATDQYPVLYLLDGESFITMAGGQVQYLSESYKIIPSMIIVGIKSPDRFKDLTPTHTLTIDGRTDTSAGSPLRTSGGGDKFFQFLKDELFPYVEKNYPVAPYRILFGHSLGGLMAMHALVSHPDMFNAYIAVSPSLQWDNEAMSRMAVEKLDKKKTANKILFFSDANEDAKFHRNQVAFDSVLKQKNTGMKFTHVLYVDESHISEPVKSFYDGIRYIYPGWHLPYNSSAFRKSMTSDTIIKHYAMLSEKYHYKVLPPQDEINQISRFLANDPKRIKDALELLRMNAENYPQSSSIYEIMGDTYMKNNDAKNALDSYQHAFSLDPSSQALQQKIKKIQP